MSPARVLPPTPENIRLAADHLRAGHVVGMPTETVYGLAGHALQPEALVRIFETKERPRFDPLIVHVASHASSLERLADSGLIDLGRLSLPARETATRLIAALWPGPLTLVLPKSAGVPDLATSGLPSVAIRMPRHPVAQALLTATGFPLAAPSANRFGRISPTDASAVREELGDRIELILDGGACEVGLESTVVAVEDSGRLTLLRPGGVPASRLVELSRGPLAALPAKASAGPTPAHPAATSPAAQPAPGLLDSHYAPQTPLRLLASPVGQLTARPSVPPPPSASRAPARKLGLLVFAGDEGEAARAFARVLGEPLDGRSITARALSRTGDLAEAARNLFAALRALDAAGTEVIFAEPCPSLEGLGHAIADRLARAARRD